MASVVFGVHPVKELLAADPSQVEKLLVKKGADAKALSQLLGMARDAGIAVREVEHSELNRLAAGGNHQNVLAYVAEFSYLDLEDWLGALPEGVLPDVLALDCIQDPHNLGALIRSAEFLGMGAVLIPKDRSASVDATVIKVSAGAAAHVPVIRVTNLARALDRLKEAGFWILGSDSAGDANLYDIDLAVPLVLVMGNESDGMRHGVARRCDWIARLPRAGKVGSLNVSVAGGILMAERLRQKRGLLAENRE